ncbi:S-adenosyl-L-methionine-dependent tRNA 4-demethylwyosine synthase TYW1 [Engraulis encrasicolus]|uniref:S-adenosyl-L-methionine-dependent tRNA 4-demethylwyosine synthase TYW1 n=1 Tax=Engraulis encrasicolus TaxID=184585 RepID=UPI002FCE9877
MFTELNLLSLTLLADTVSQSFGAELPSNLDNVRRYTEGYIWALWHNRLYIYTAAAVVVGVWFALNLALKKKKIVKPVSPWRYQTVETKTYPKVETKKYPLKEKTKNVSAVKIFYGSQTGTAKGFARDLAEDVTGLGLESEVIDLKDYDPDDRLSDECTSKAVCVFLLATYTEGKPTENAEWFCKWLEEASTDFRYGKTYLKGLKYAVFGLGNSVYEDHYNTVGTSVDKWLWMLSGSRVLTRGEGDCNVAKSRRGSVQADFAAWKTRLLSRLKALARGEKKPCSGKCKNGTCKNNKKKKQQQQQQQQQQGAAGEPGKCSSEQKQQYSSEEELVESSSEGESSGDEGPGHGSVIDMEDLGNVMTHFKKAKQKKEDGEDRQKVRLSKLSNGSVAVEKRRKQGGGGEEEEAEEVEVEVEEEERREMITPALRDALTKQGYKLIGSHSGVKLCRWTKSMLRGRGGCYKHTFYGIESHRCMEATPSLACANKCVFCWRHHTNPVGTEWRWKMDPAEKILLEAVENHQSMIKQFRGVPGVRAERFEEGLAVKHCALSLVGEPIMYPEINAFLRLLHQQRISSFLVTNAQFPDEIRTLVPVTQLYVSVDASTKDSLKRIDRPLFKDFWQRFLDSLRALGEKQQRTVYRLTLVKAWNVDELKAYSELIALGQPDFIEVKGVTYCGESSASSLTMANVPWHEEVIFFVQQLANMLPDYEIACEHEHSNCLLLAHHKFKVDGEWWTWIDYERFQDLVAAHEASGGTQTFSASDYMAKTPSWALFGAGERGFDPADTRYQRKNKTKDISGC